MRRVGLVLGALVILVGALAPAFAQQPFSDVPLDHWAYAAVNKLAETGLIEGYPNGTFMGKQALTRYEFAQAIARLMDRLEQMRGIPGPRGERGEPGAPGSPGTALTPEQQATLDRLAREFAPELRALRSDLDSLTRRVEELESRPAARGPAITVSGDISVRAGAYGNSLGTEDVDTTGYPFFAELGGGGGGGGGGESPITVDGGIFFGAVAPYGGINLPDFVGGAWTDVGSSPSFIGSIPISDALKDAFKASDFLTQRTRVILSGALNDTTSVNVTLLADPTTNNARDTWMDAIVNSPNQFTGNGVMDTVQVNEAWVAVRTHLLGPVTATAGKQFVRRGLGLLVDNSQQALKGVRLDWDTGRRLSWGIYWAMLDREMFFGRSTGALGLPQLEPLVTALAMYGRTNGQDNYNLYYANFNVSRDWNLGVNWLASGFNLEEGWSASVEGQLFGLGVYGEFAQLRKWPTGRDFYDANGNGTEDAGELGIEDAGRDAWMAGLRWDNDWVSVTGEYGELDAGYAFSPEGAGWSAVGPFMGGSDMFTSNLPFSALHPLAEVNPHYINWVDRPLFLDPTNIARGWHVGMHFPRLLGRDTPVCISYASGDAFNPQYLSWILFSGVDGAGAAIAKPSKFVDADPVWWVQVSHPLSPSVTARLLYGRREVENVMSRQQVPIVVDSDGPHFATADAIQVIRGELVVGF